MKNTKLNESKIKFWKTENMFFIESSPKLSRVTAPQKNVTYELSMDILSKSKTEMIKKS